MFWLPSAFYQVGPDEESMEIFEWWIFTMFIKKQKGKETQKLEQTQFYVIAFDLKKKKKLSSCWDLPKGLP